MNHSEKLSAMKAYLAAKAAYLAAQTEVKLLKIKLVNAKLTMELAELEAKETFAKLFDLVELPKVKELL